MADLPVATSTPAGPAKPVHTASTGDGIWVLDLVDGRPVIEETVVTLRITGNRLDGYDGCNRYGGLIYVEGQRRMKRLSPGQMGCFHFRPS